MSAKKRIGQVDLEPGSILESESGFRLLHRRDDFPAIAVDVERSGFFDDGPGLRLDSQSS